jgi:hypothetical protein
MQTVSGHGQPGHLEWLTPVIHEAGTDDSSQGEQRNMNVETALETNAQLAATKTAAPIG